MTSSTTVDNLNTAMVMFLLAESWESSLAVIEVEPELASDEAIALLQALIEEAQQIEDERSEALGQHLVLLQRCVLEGTAEVFAELRSSQPQPESLEDILSALAEASFEPADMPRRIQLCRAGLALVDPDGDRELWARLRAALGTALLNPPLGDRDAHVAEAIVALTEAAELFEVSSVERARALNNLGQAHEAAGWDGDAHTEAAIDAYETAIDSLPGLDDPLERAQTLNNLGSAYLKGGHRRAVEKAVDLHRQAAALIVRDEHPFEWAAVQSNLGMALAARGSPEDLDEAIETFQAACKVIDPSSSPVPWARVQTQLANALQRRGSRTRRHEDLYAAIATYERVLDALREHSTPVDEAAALVNLGNALVALGGATGEQSDRAIECYRNALRLLDKRHQPIEWAQAQNNLGNALRRRARQTRSARDADSAIRAYEKAASVLTRERAPASYAQIEKNIGTSFAILAGALRDRMPTGRLRRTGRRCRRGQKCSGPITPSVASVLYRIAKVHRDAGDWPAMRVALERALEIDEATGTTAPRMARRYRRLAYATQEMGDLEAAEQAYERALEIDRKFHEADHPYVFADLTALGNIRRLRADDEPPGWISSARSRSARAPTRVERRCAWRSPVSPTSFSRRGDVAGAERTLERAVALDRTLYGSGEARVQDAMVRLAHTLSNAGATARSDAAFERAIELADSNELSAYPRLAAWIGGALDDPRRRGTAIKRRPPRPVR